MVISRPMRRVLLLLLALVLPLKAVAAAVVPIVGSPNHAHVAHAADAQPMHAHCDGAAEVVDADAGSLHDHACPHLAMVVLLRALPVIEPDRRAPGVGAEAHRPLHSVVLKIPLPPPTARS